MKPPLEYIMHKLLNEKIQNLEKHFDADVLTYFGPFKGIGASFLKIVEELADDKDKRIRFILF